ncbi:MAG: bi-domain-containing oxidoreductase [Trueperaceae bacterium]|nr:MAG: bi-domain-containing oxidoreductase [Trueperaceae bacterium]
MKQVLQSLESGSTEVIDVPVPKLRPGHLLIRSQATVVSSGTERMLVDFGRANLLQKARQQPERVRDVIQKARTDGIVPTLRAVRSRLGEPIALGYCNAGVVIGVGDGVEGYQLGDRVISNGPHAEIVCVPVNLCAKIPKSEPSIDFETAAFTVPAAIGLQGIRLAAPTLGESFVVIGLGLIGLLTVQLLKAHGCRVLGLDLDAGRLDLARTVGIQTTDIAAGEDPLEAARHFSGDRGVDGVLITASTSSSEPVHQAATMCRKRGRIVLIGVTGLELRRADFYEKELSFQVSCSYGPGRYDPDYEEKGQDYPFGFVRWTEGRNFEAVLELMRDQKLQITPLISHHFGIDDAAKAYDLVTGDTPSLGIVLNYPPLEALEEAPLIQRLIPAGSSSFQASGKPVVGVIGAGNHTRQMLLPALTASGAAVKIIGSSGGVSAVTAARKFGIAATTTDVDHIFSDPEIDTVFITTRHDSHADLCLQTLEAGKHTFVEKPLAITRTQLAAIEKRYQELVEQEKAPLLTVGFNRRFAPHSQKIKALLGTVGEPKAFIMTVNAGAVPEDHWTQDPEVGGGRLIGEACHFVDLLRFLADAPITGVQATSLGDSARNRHDRVSATLTFGDGSIGTVHYLANGHRSFPKERLEVFTAGRILVMDNFVKLRGYGWPRFRPVNLRTQDKGHRGAVEAFVKAVQGEAPAPIPVDQIFEVSRAVFDLVDALQP